MLRWPNGHWCIEGNLFIEKLLLDGLSLKGRGGTISTYSFYISGLLRYIEDNHINFHSLTDDHFSKYLLNLYSEKSEKRGIISNKRNRTTVHTIGSVILDFLDFVGTYYNNPTYVSENGQIKAYKKQERTKLADGHVISRMTWKHRGLGPYSAINRRMPIGTKEFENLKSAPAKTNNSFIRLRRNVMLSLLDETGMRRMEAVMLTVGDVQNAISQMYLDLASATQDAKSLIKMLGPHVFEFNTVKHKHISRRQIPIDAITLQFYESYLSRRKTRLRQLGLNASNPDGPFLISFSTGKALEANTITQELLTLARAAEITTPCSPHLIRHLYIVRLFIRFLLAHKIENEDHFRRAMIDVAGFKEKVRELTGHASIDSLEPYLELALDEVGKLTSTMSNVKLQELMDSLASTMFRIKSEVAHGLNLSAAFEQLSHSISLASEASKNPTL